MNRAAPSRAVGVIPARWGSTRFPGKSLALIDGKPLIAWVVERAQAATRLSEVIVATDDTRIVDVVEALHVRAVMTRPDHPSGTDRIAEAIDGLDADIVLNIQGDEPLISPSLIDELADVMAADSCWDMATAVTPIVRDAELTSPSVVKCVWAADGAAMYFSRSPIPHVRDADSAPEGTLTGVTWEFTPIDVISLRVWLKRGLVSWRKLKNSSSFVRSTLAGACASSRHMSRGLGLILRKM